MIKDYYRILGLADNAEDVVIRTAFKLLAHRYHPDKWLQEQPTANRMMAEINEAYRTLSDPLLKLAYDQKRVIYQVDSDFYRILGVLGHVDIKMIQVAYEVLSQKYRHSSSHALAEKRLVEINQAYQILADVTKRKTYDFKQKSASYFSRSNRRSGLSLWKVYLVYNLVFYLIIAGIIFLL
jgi:DnaJ-class molecular chaperone